MRHFLNDKGAPHFTSDPQTYLGAMHVNTPEETMALSVDPLIRFMRNGPAVELYNLPNHWQPEA